MLLKKTFKSTKSLICCVNAMTTAATLIPANNTQPKENIIDKPEVKKED